MDPLEICPDCHVQIRSTDYFCYNCGKNLQPRPLSTSLSTQLWLYVKSLLLPPMGIIWGARYLHQPDAKSKFVGLFTMVITVVEIIWLIQSTVNIVNSVNQEIYQQFKIYGL